MKIGVSGAGGYLGKAVVSELLRRADGHEETSSARGGEPVAGTHDTTAGSVVAAFAPVSAKPFNFM